MSVVRAAAAEAEVNHANAVRQEHAEMLRRTRPDYVAIREAARGNEGRRNDWDYNARRLINEQIERDKNRNDPYDDEGWWINIL